ncbi:uncharacterized protein B0T23DRAFT_324756, partial [Neurospora hispaniola]
DNTNSKYFYNFIRTIISKVTNEARTNILEEYTNLRRSNFDSILSFLIRYNLLRKRVTKYSLKIDQTVEILNLYNIVKR